MNDPDRSAASLARVRRPAGPLATGPRKALAQRIRAIFNTLDRTVAERLLKQAIEAWSAEAPKFAEWAEESLPEGFTVFDLSLAQCPHPRTTYGLERINIEIKRRTRVASIFPNMGSCRTACVPFPTCWPRATRTG